MKKIITFLFTALTVCLLCVGFCDKQAKASSFRYEKLSDKTVKVTRYLGKKSKVVIPKKIGKRRVTEIGSYLFGYGDYTTKTIIIPEGVVKVDDMAFYSLFKLKTVSFPLTLYSINKQCGIGFYSEATDHEQLVIKCYKGSAAFYYALRYLSSANTVAKKTNKKVVSYEANGGSCSTTYRILKKNGTYGKLPKAKRTGYKFLGWYSKKSGGKKVTSKKKITAVKLYAHWKLTDPAVMISSPKYSKKVTEYSTVYFGNYKQSDASGKKKDKIKWRVLNKTGNKAFLMADTVLDIKKLYENDFDSTGTSIQWNNTTMRSWLNGYGANNNLCKLSYQKDNFLDQAFSSKEQAAIVSTTWKNTACQNLCKGWANSKYTSIYAVDSAPTVDKISLIDYATLNSKKFGFENFIYTDSLCKWNDGSMCSQLNAFIMAKVAELKLSANDLSWTSRTMTYDDAFYDADTNTGSTDSFSMGATDFTGVRPVLYLDLSKKNVWSNAGTISISR